MWCPLPLFSYKRMSGSFCLLHHFGEKTLAIPYSSPLPHCSCLLGVGVCVLVVVCSSLPVLVFVFVCMCARRCSFACKFVVFMILIFLVFDCSCLSICCLGLVGSVSWPMLVFCWSLCDVLAFGGRGRFYSRHSCLSSSFTPSIIIMLWLLSLIIKLCVALPSNTLCVILTIIW